MILEYDYTEQLTDLLESSQFLLSNIKPSEWGEQTRVMTPDISPIPGKLSYKNSPYTREIVDCLSPDHPARIVAVMKGAQIGFSTTVIEVGIGWIISQSPGNIMFLVGHEELVEEAIVKVDRMIDSCGLRSLIRPNINRTRNMKTGDTNRSKEFPNGSLISGTPSNHKLLRNRPIQYGFIDDFEAAKGSTKQSGSTFDMIEQRFAAFDKKMKLFFISTPELKQGSNIEPVFLLGDQRKYNIPCPCCGEFIPLEWSVNIGDTEEKGGIYWETGSGGHLIENSVGYICQKCGDFFNDRQKDKLLVEGIWVATARPSEEGYYSYHISSLYAPSYMFGWKHYVRKYLQACPPGEKRKEDSYKTFVNLVLGETYEEPGEAPKANELQKNIRKYEVGIIPEKLSEKDGNGKIVLLTCACDLNGTVEDARLDYEIVGWSESEASYSVKHGSIGTFIPKEGSKRFKEDRERWTYEHNKTNSVWRELDKVLDSLWLTDTGRKMKIFVTGIDTGHYSHLVYPYVDKSNFNIISLKGDKENKYIPLGYDVATFKTAKERPNLYLVQVNKLKDRLADLIRLRWEEGFDESQPPGYLNFPTPSGGSYLFSNYFSHYESEHRKVESKNGTVSSRWEKKTSNAQNHFWDVKIYNFAVRDIMIYLIGKELNMKNFMWNDYVNIALGRNQ